MTKRSEISVVYNLWNDSQRVDLSDLNVEQDRNIQTDAAIVNNHFGSGVLPGALTQAVLFDSENLPASQAALLAAGDFDGTGLDVHQQPSDSTLGNILEIELTDSTVLGRLSVKVAIIGLAFDDTLQSERLYFHRNGKQVTSKHYKQILTIFFNDFKGNNICSRVLGGRIVIREAESFQLSLDPIMVAQDVEPDIFWRDFKLADITTSLFNTIQAGMGSEFSADGLNINITGQPERLLEPDDVTSQLGQKFQAAADNIQKITLLMSVTPDEEAEEDDTFDWSGDLIVSIYPLQTSVSCPTDIIPELALDFDPAPQSLAQLSYNQDSLREAGYVLNAVPQPVDFVFNFSKIAVPGNIIVDNYYAIVVKRSGSTSIGTLRFSTGRDTVEEGRVTLFSGVWVDVSEEDLWFQVWTDAVKLADGQAYDTGQGIQYGKTIIDAESGATIDYQVNHLSFEDTGENTLNIGLVQAVSQPSQKEPDERTGSDVFARQQLVPSFSFISSSELTDLQSIGNPLVIGGVKDTNPKLNPTLEKNQLLPGLVNGDEFIIVNPDADLLSLNLLGSILIPNTTLCAAKYKIVKVTLCTDGYGDLNGDGEIDADDQLIMAGLIGESLYFDSTQQGIVDGYLDTLQLLKADLDGDGYITTSDANLLTSYINKSIGSFTAGSSFTYLTLRVQQLIGRDDGYYSCGDGYIALDGYTGLDIVSASDLSALQLEYDGYISTPVLEVDPLFSTVPFPGTTYKIVPLPYWQPWLVAVSSAARWVPAAFTESSAIVLNECSSVTELCQDRNEVIPDVDPGRNDFLVPDNLFIKNGQILRTDGSSFPVDLEIGIIILELPASIFSNSVLNVFEKLVSDQGNGLSRGGSPALKYSDCSTVQDEDLLLNRVRLTAQIMSIYKNMDGYDSDLGYGIIINPNVVVNIDNTTGLLTLTTEDLSVDELLDLKTKIQITVYLKKAGFNNSILTIQPNQVEGLFS